MSYKSKYVSIHRAQLLHLQPSLLPLTSVLLRPINIVTAQIVIARDGIVVQRFLDIGSRWSLDQVDLLMFKTVQTVRGATVRAGRAFVCVFNALD